MKNSMFFLTILCSVILTMTSCTKEEIIADKNIDKMSETLRSYKDGNSNAQAIVLAAPSIYNDYYAEVFQDIVDFQVEYANKIDGRDEVIILVDSETRPYYAGRVPNYVLVEAIIEDIWIRDFSPVIAGNQVKFDYLPDYLTLADANLIDNSFNRWFDKVGMQYGKESNLILDGGNVVDNGAGKVIITDRFLYDNPQFTKAQAKNRLKKLMGATHIAIIKESPGDATGHSDGMVMWTDENTILLQDHPTNIKNQIVNELKNSFPGVKIVIVPDYYEDETWGDFSSACNLYVNSLVTNDYIYVPTFNDSHDTEMLNFIQSHTSKKVVEVPAEKVCFMGGSVRCLSWQLDGQFADDILFE